MRAWTCSGDNGGMREGLFDMPVGSAQPIDVEVWDWMVEAKGLVLVERLFFLFTTH